MKICLVSDNLVGYHDTWSGAEMIVQYLDNLLRKRGQDVALLAVKSEKETPENIFPLPALTGKFWSFKKIIPIHIFIRTIAAFFILRKMKPDVLHFFHSNSLFLPVMISARILRIPTTFTVLDYWILCPTGHCLLKNNDICPEREGKVCLKCVPLPKYFERMLIRYLRKDLKYLITFTETSKKRLIERGFPAEKIKVEYVYEFSFNSNNIQSAEKIFRPHDILFVGTSKKQKGLHIVISSLPAIISKIPDARLIVIGRSESQDKERIDGLVKQLNLEKNIEFLGQKPNKEVLKIVSNSNLLVVAEQWFSDFGPVALVEALALGVPVVSGNLGSPSDFIKDGLNGFLAEYNNPESFSQKIISALLDKEGSFRMGEKARETIKNYFGQNREEKITNLYISSFRESESADMEIGWVKISSKKYGGVVYEEKAMDVLKDCFNLEYIKINSNFFKRGYLRAPELVFNLLKLKGRKDLWVRDNNTVITAPFDRTRGKKVAIIHHIDYSISRPLFKPIDFIIEKLIYQGLRKMDAIITVSEYWKEHFLKMGFSNVFVVYNGFDLNEFNITFQEAENFKEENRLQGKPIIYLGNCQRAKGVEESYKALKDLPVFLVTSGEKMIDIPTLNLNLSYRDYLKLLKSSSIVLTMSKFKEGWCRTAHEAMLLKIPVIGSGLGGMGELLEGGKQIICQDFKDLRGRVEYLLKDPQARIKMGEQGYDFAKNFTSEKFKSDWLSIIDKLC